MDLASSDTQDRAIDAPASAADGLLRAAGAPAPAGRLQDCGVPALTAAVKAWTASFGAAKPFTRESCGELAAAVR
jgi:hypothetical protein